MQSHRVGLWRFCAFVCFGLVATSSAGDIGDPEGRLSSFDERVYLKHDPDGWHRVVRRDGETLSVESADFVPPRPDLSALSAASGGQDQPSLAGSALFQPYVAIPVGSWPEAVAIGDLNSDGRNDVALVTSYFLDPGHDKSLFVFLQDDEGSLQVQAPIQLGAWLESVDVGDVTGDGRDDVVIGADGTGIVVVPQSAAGTLTSPILYPTIRSYQVRIGDFDSDGRQDVVGIDWGSHSKEIEIFLQQADGTLALEATYLGTHDGYDDLEVGDLDDDGRDDVLVMSGQGLVPNLSVLLQRPAGLLDDPIPYQYGSRELTSGVGIGDVSRDGRADVVASHGGNRPYSKVATWLQTEGGSLGSPVDLDSYDIPAPVVIADVNADGLNDVLVAHDGWEALGIYLQTESGSLTGESLVSLPFASHYNPHGMAAGDVNGDGRVDVAIADYNHGLVLLFGDPSVPPMDTDWGDAPDPPYPSEEPSNGARHTIGALRLGAHADAESGALVNVGANGDDTVGLDDEDGVLLPSPLIAGQLAVAEVNASGTGYLDAWVDFNRNGDWSDPEDRIFTAEWLAGGPQSLSFSVPETAQDGETYARFRISSLGGLGFDGYAADGEVEDYRVEIRQALAVEGAFFKNLVLVKADGSSLEKKPEAPRGWNAGASSVQQIGFGGGFVEFTTDDTDTKKVCGLGHEDVNQRPQDVDYGFLLSGDKVKIREGGALRTTSTGTTSFGTFAPGDRFLVAVQGGTVSYWLRDALLYTSTLPPAYPLEVDTSLYDPRATISDVTIGYDPRPALGVEDVAVAEADAGSAQATFTITLSKVAADPVQVDFATANLEATAGEDYEPVAGTLVFEPGEALSQAVAVEIHGDTSVEGNERFALLLSGAIGAHLLSPQAIGTILDDDAVEPRPVHWTRLDGVAVGQSGVLKKVNKQTRWNAGASSTEELMGGDGYLEFSTKEADKDKACGLSHGDADSRLADINFALCLLNGRIKISENGTFRTSPSGGNSFGRFAAGDRFRVGVEGPSVVYRLNGEVLYTSTVAPTFPLVADASLRDPQATISDAVVYPPPPLPFVSVLDEGHKWSPSLAIGADGLALIGYVDGMTRDVMVAHCDDDRCADASTNLLVKLGRTATFPKVAIGGDGLGLIGYVNHARLLKVAHCENAVCSAASRHTLAEAEEGGAIGRISVAVGGDGLGLISFVESPDTLKVAHCRDTGCASADLFTLDSSPEPIFGLASVAGSDGRVLVFYSRNGVIKAAHCNDSDCSSATIATVAAGRLHGPAGAAMGADGLALVTFAEPLETGYDLLRVAHCEDAPCTAATLSTIYSPYSGGIGAIAVGRDGLGLILCSAFGRREIAHCDDTACTSASISPLDLPASDSVLAIGSRGLGLIAHTRPFEGLRVARCPNLLCAPEPAAPPDSGWQQPPEAP